MKKISVLAATLLLCACASGGKVGVEKDASDLPTLLLQAEAAIKKSADAGHQWRDGTKFLAQARAARDAGDNASAMNFAKRAKRQGELGYKQAQEQRDAAPWLF